MNAIILSVGDELVLGQVIETNSAWISRHLAQAGCAVSAHLTVPDDLAAITQAIRHSCSSAELLVITGGLGPTEDDLTRQALAAVMDAPLELHESWVLQLQQFFSARSQAMPQTNRIQAMIPRGAELIRNPCGTAAGIRASLPRDGSGHTGNTGASPAETCEVFALPGVPQEMQTMFTQSVLPFAASRSRGAVILSRTLHTFGMGESAVAERLGQLMLRGRNPSVGTTAAQGIVSLRISARYESAELAQEAVAQTEAACRAALGDLIYGADEETLPQAVARLLKEHPVARQWAPAVCTAESCTGGLLAKYLTDVPGSSTYFRQGWVTYDNEAKIRELGVSRQTLASHGAVSEATVREMALGAAARCGAPLAMAVSGIAGPEGGTPAKPVGTVCLALSYPDMGVSEQLAVETRTFRLFGDRAMIRERACLTALAMLRYYLLGKPAPF